jgi:hypothetical protein
MTKKLVYSVAALSMRVLTSASVFWTIVTHLRTLSEADCILLFPCGGFGHVLSAPDWLRRLEPSARTLTIFGRWPGRQNAMAAELWGSERFLWTWSAIWLPRLGVVADSDWCDTLFLFAEEQLKRLWPKKRYIHGVWGLVRATPRPSWVEQGSKYARTYESRLGALRLERPAPALHLGERRIQTVERALTRTVGNGYRRRCNLYLRNKTGDVTNMLRCSQPLTVYLPLIRYLIEQEYLVMITGDVGIKGTVLEGAPGVVDWRRAGISKDLFHVFCGTETDLHVGNLSGGSAYTYVADIQTILIDAMAFGDSYPKATIQYKRLLRSDGSLVPLATLFKDYALDFECRGCRIVDSSPLEMLEVVRDVVENGLGRIPYGVRAESLGLYAPILKSADARLSPVWVRGFPEISSEMSVGDASFSHWSPAAPVGQAYKLSI